MQSVYLQRIMKKNADKGYEKTKPISVPLAPFIVYNSRVVQERPIHKFVAPRT